MSGTLPANEPVCLDAGTPTIDVLLEARTRDIGDFSVRRVLPASQRRLVGPFIFFDHFGPVRLPAGRGLDVRPHPHIALATVTYLFEGEILHRDSLGSVQAIRPGDVNWMVAGRGIVHSERSPEAERRLGPRLHGLQCWVALPLEHEEAQPSFQHHGRADLPAVQRPGAELDVLVGAAYGASSPVAVLSPTLYVHARLDAGAHLPVEGKYEERAVYVVEGTIRCEGRPFSSGTMVVLQPAAEAAIEAEGPARIMIVGGDRLAGERHVWWNFVSSSPARIEQAKEDWRSGRFPGVPGDEDEFIPLPES
jgi:redox-sensitive bicupin YhaK (pirin superfamily)